jgi:hypothetical protein
MQPPAILAKSSQPFFRTGAITVCPSRFRGFQLRIRAMRRSFRTPFFLLVSVDVVLVSFDLLQSTRLLMT